MSNLIVTFGIKDKEIIRLDFIPPIINTPKAKQEIADCFLDYFDSHPDIIITNDNNRYSFLKITEDYEGNEGLNG